MKAVFFDQNGGPEVLGYGEVSTPIPKKGEALIKVKACALNHLDLWLRKRPITFKGPHIPGSDVAGVVEEVNGKSKFRPGDEVIINPAIPCGTCQPCKNNQPCELVTIFGAKTQGGYAEYVTVPIPQVYAKPKNASFAEAAAFPLTFLTAWHMLVGRANVKKGETVFVWGASGGLGSAGIQIAKNRGARVIAAARSKEAGEKIKAMGVDRTVNYTEEDAVQQVKNYTQGKGVDIVFDSVGAKTWNASLAMLRPHGKLVYAGTTSGDMVTFDASDVYYYQQSILGARMGTKKEFEMVLKLFSQGKLKPMVDKVFPLHRAREAQQCLEEGKQMGKVVLEM
ncbi:MAG: zinc-binding dehydrogenase [Candidatus Diapherotrites archaeon]|nr:zinc-binding dehydrogenase [Candidatus Diapherotrites archaeon]